MKLLVGLGNLGEKYENTRHNVGFEVIDKIAEEMDVKLKFSNFENCGFLMKGNICGQPVLLLKPSQFMNNSGIVVRKVKDYYKIKQEDILIIVDDCSLDLGNIRLRVNGTSAGHNGLKSIISYLGSQDFARLKIGIGNDKEADLADFVLGKFSKAEKTVVENVLNTAADAVCVWVKDGNEKVMQKFNKKNEIV